MKKRNFLQLFLTISTIIIVTDVWAFNPRRVFKKKCSSCHSLKSEEKLKGPNFIDLEHKRGQEWISNYLSDSKKSYHKFSKYKNQKQTDLINYIFAIGAGSEGEIKAGIGNAKAGRVMSSSCLSCHGPAGYASNPEVPHLRGQNAKYMINQLRAFKNGNRVDENGSMVQMAKALSERDIVNISEYFQQLNNDDTEEEN